MTITAFWRTSAIDPDLLQGLDVHVLSEYSGPIERALRFLDYHFFTYFQRMISPIILARLFSHIDADYHIASFWPTAFSAYWLQYKSHGRGAHYIQHFEPLFYPRDKKLYRVAEKAYELPLIKLTISRWLQSIMRKYGKDVYYVGYFVDPCFKPQQLYPEKLERYKKNGVNVVLAIYFSDWFKGPALLIDTLNELAVLNKNFVAVIIGKVNESMRAKIRFPTEIIGPLTRRELALYYSAADVFVNTSIIEGFCLPPLEAMACGCPTVITDSLGVREYAINGYNTLIVPKDPRAIATAINELLKNEPLRDSLRKNGMETAKRFSIENVARRFEAILR